ncbi:hypothetical protein ACSBR2_016491 [Camellia fascicularis]
MDSVKGLRWRKQALKPIVTNTKPEIDNGGGGGGGGNTVEVEVEEPLSPAARLFHEPSFNVYIIAIMGCKTRTYPDVVKESLKHTLLKHPRFSSLQVVDEKPGGAMKWVQTKVNIDNHIIAPTLDPNMPSPENFIEDYISNLSTTTIFTSKPIWDLHLLTSKPPPQRRPASSESTTPSATAPPSCLSYSHLPKKCPIRMHCPQFRQPIGGAPVVAAVVDGSLGGFEGGLQYFGGCCDVYGDCTVLKRIHGRL